MATERSYQSYKCLAKDWQLHKGVYEEQVIQGKPAIAAKSKMSVVFFNNGIVEADYKSHHILLMVLEGDAKVEHDNKWRTYHDRITKLDRQRRQALSMIRGHCMQVLIYKIIEEH